MMPVSPPIIDPALLGHLFFAVREAGPGRRVPSALAAVWDALEPLGINGPVAGFPAELQPFAADGFTSRLTVLGGRGDPCGGIRQAVFYQDHDVIGVSVMLAPAADTAWAVLADEWHAVTAAASQHAVVLGTAEIFIGQVPDGQPAARTLRRLLPRLPGPLPDRASATEVRFHRGIRLWELPPLATHRRLLAMSPAAEADSLDRWLWSDDRPGLVPLTGYLLHAAKLRYEHGVLVRDLAAIRAAVAEADAACTEISAAVVEGDVVPDELRATAAMLARLQARRTGLILSLSRVRAMSATVRTAERNLAGALEPLSAGETGGVLDSDRQISRWAAEQLQSEETYLQAANERAEQVVAMSRTVIESAQRSRQESLTLLQTSLLGAMVTALTAIQSLEYKLPIDHSLQAPLITFLASLALWLPSAVVHWPPGARRGRGWRLLDGLLSGVVTGSLAWLVVGVVGRVAEHRPADPAWTVPVGVSAGLLGAVAVWLLGRRAKSPG